MTNREYMAKQLSNPDWIDDGGASYESMVEYNINCPYFHGDTRSHCKDIEAEYLAGRRNSLSPTKYECIAFKHEWLEAEVDE